MKPEHRAFFAALAVSLTRGKPVERIACRTDYIKYSFIIEIQGAFVSAYDPARRSKIDGKLPLLKMMPENRVFAFTGENLFFLGRDHTANEPFRVTLVDDIVEVFDSIANRTFLYAVDDPVLALPQEEAPSEPAPAAEDAPRTP